MKDEIVSFTTAQLAKEKGFNIPCYRLYVDKIYLDENTFTSINSRLTYNCVTAPTQSLLQRWLREVHNIFITIDQNFEIDEIANKYLDKTNVFYEHQAIRKHNGKYFLIVRGSGEINPPNSSIYNSYEIALEDGLKKALKLIKDENKTSDKSTSDRIS